MGFLSLILLLLTLTAAVLLVRRYLLPEPGQGPAALAAGFGASVGGVTLWMLILGVLPGRALSAVTIVLFPAALWAGGLWMIARRPRGMGGASLRQGADEFLHSPWPARILLIAAGAALAVSLAHTLYYPFVGEDEVSRYAYYARVIFQAGAIPARVADYPLLLPLGYAYAFFVSGGVNEHLAKIVSWGFAPATVAATYWLAALWGGKRARWAGLAAAFTLAVTRLFVDWSPLGYVDIPTGLYFALAAGFVSLWVQSGRLRHALAAGAAAGLALWTKQAGFAAALSLGLVFAAAGLWGAQGRRTWAAGLAALALAALIGLPWYARNAALAGWANAVPGPGGFYYEQARRGLLDWLPFLSWAEEFGYGVAPIYLAGCVAAVAAFLWPGRADPRSDSEANELRITDYALRSPLNGGILLSLVFLLPYLALWWGWFSYDPRFLLTVLPFYAALVGLGWTWIAGRVDWRPRPALAAALTAVLAGTLLLGGTYTRLGGAYRLLTAPLATDQEKLLQYKPDVASTVAFLRETARPGEDRIYSMDPRLAYYLLDYDFTAGYPTTLAQLEGYDYLVAGSWAFNDVYPRLGEADNEVVAHLDDPQVLPLLFTSELGTVKVYRVQIPSSQAVR
jgi:hypothetical protein